MLSGSQLSGCEFLRKPKMKDKVHLNFQREQTGGHVQWGLHSHKTNSSHLKIGHPKRKVAVFQIPTIHFQVRTVSFREGIRGESPKLVESGKYVFFFIIFFLGGERVKF